jgi:hypothetical protein
MPLYPLAVAAVLVLSASTALAQGGRYWNGYEWVYYHRQPRVIGDSGVENAGVYWNGYQWVRRTEQHVAFDTINDPNRHVRDPGSYQRVDYTQYDHNGVLWHYRGYKWTSYGEPHSEVTRTALNLSSSPGVGYQPSVSESRAPRPGVGYQPSVSESRAPRPGVGYQPSVSESYGSNSGVGYQPSVSESRAPSPGVGYQPSQTEYRRQGVKYQPSQTQSHYGVPRRGQRSTGGFRQQSSGGAYGSWGRR